MMAPLLHRAAIISNNAWLIQVIDSVQVTRNSDDNKYRQNFCFRCMYVASLPIYSTTSTR